MIFIFFSELGIFGKFITFLMARIFVVGSDVDKIYATKLSNLMR